MWKRPVINYLYLVALYAHGKEELRCGLAKPRVWAILGSYGDGYQGSPDFSQLDFGDLRTGWVGGNLVWTEDCTSSPCQRLPNCANLSANSHVRGKEDFGVGAEVSQSSKLGAFFGALLRVLLFRF